MVTPRQERLFFPVPVWDFYCPWTKLLLQVRYSFKQKKKAPCSPTLKEISRAVVQWDWLSTRKNGQNRQRALAWSPHLKIRVLLCWPRNPRVGFIMGDQTHTSYPPETWNINEKVNLLLYKGDKVFPKTIYPILSSPSQLTRSLRGCMIGMKSEHRDLQALDIWQSFLPHNRRFQWLPLTSLSHPLCWIPASRLRGWCPANSLPLTVILS